MPKLNLTQKFKQNLPGITLYVLLLLSLPGLAANVSTQTAKKVAGNLFAINFPNNVHRQVLNPTLTYTQVDSDGTALFYVFDMNPITGFVIVSAQDNIIPVLAYSNENSFPTSFEATGTGDWVYKISRQIHQTVANNLVADARITNLWTDYLNGNNPGGAKSNTVSPLLSVTWNQAPYYNQLCPVNTANNHLCVTGCVATAMAQIMKYWNYPPQGSGSFSYTDDQAHGYSHNCGYQSVNFGNATYQWTLMPNFLSSNNSAVATLMYHCGVSVAMDYGDLGSGAYVLQSDANAAYGTSNAPCAQHSFATYFLYNPNTLQGAKEYAYSSTQWINLIENELTSGRPVQYMGYDPNAGGHTWVCDGFDNNNYLHMNWGWGGQANGYYAINNLSPGGYSFSQGDAALIGIQPPNSHPNPNTNYTCVTIQKDFSSDSSSYFSEALPSINYPSTYGVPQDLIASQWTYGGVLHETRSLLKFDLSDIPPGSAIVSAKISLYANPASGNGYANQPTYGINNACYLSMVTTPWSVYGVTWNNQPTDSIANRAQLPQSTSTAQDYLDLDIDSFVQYWVQDPAHNYGLMIKTLATGAYNSMIFCTPANADTSKRPKLEVCYIPPCNAIASFTSQSLSGTIVQFTNTSSCLHGFSSNWTFSNSQGAFSSSTQTNPVVNFIGLPPFTATLVITDSLFGTCKDTATATITIHTNTVCLTLQPGVNGDSCAFVSGAMASTNYNTLYGLEPEVFASQWTYNGTPHETRGLLKFNISAIPPGSTVTSATLSLYANNTSGNGYQGRPTYGIDNACNLQQVTSAWSTFGVNWNNQPTTTTNGEVLMPQATNQSEDYLNMDITQFVQNWVTDSTSNYGMMIKMIGPDHYNSLIFCSSNYSDSSRRPRLDICYIPCNTYAGFSYRDSGNGIFSFTSSSTSAQGLIYNWTFSNANGPIATSSLPNPTITFSGLPPYSAKLVVTDSIKSFCTDSITQTLTAPGCIVFRTDATAGDNDAFISSISPTANYGTAPDFLCSQWTYNCVPGEVRAFFKFDLSSIPTNAIISSAKVSLYANSTNVTSSNGYPGQPTYGCNNASYLQRITSPWSALSVNWNNQPQATSVDEAFLSQSTNYVEDYTDIDITNIAQDWIQNPGNNYGLRLKMLTNNYYNSMIFCSSNHPDSTKRPKLEICYNQCASFAAFVAQDLGNGSVQFHNASSASTTFTSHWTFYNGNGMLSTSSVANPTVTFTGPQPYSATLQLFNSTNIGCTDSSFQLLNIKTGVKDINGDDEKLLIYPNPGKSGSLFSIKLPSGLTWPAEVSVHDMLGRSIKQSITGKENGYLKMKLGEEVEDGVYTITIKDNTQQLSGKVVIAK